MNLIQAAWEASNVDRVTDLLAATTPNVGEVDPRRFEWHYWDRMCHSELRALRASETGVVNDLTYSADGRRLAGVSDDGIQVWDTATWQEQVRLGGCLMAAFPPDWSQATTTALSRSIARVYGVASRELLRTMNLPSGHVVAALAYSPDGRRLVGAASSFLKGLQTIQVWDAATGQTLRTITWSEESPNVVRQFSPDCLRLAGAGDPDGRTLKVWDAATGQVLLTSEKLSARG
jgi:WD40 repeat protein